MNHSWREWLVLPLACALTAGFLWLEMRTETTVPKAPTPVVKKAPDFRSMDNVEAKKSAFFAYLLPFIRTANDAIVESRQRLQRIRSNLTEGASLSAQDTRWLATIATQYRVKKYSTEQPKQLIESLLRRVDVVPASLTLAQAANESAWGTSRFAVNGNNYFGIWCFEKECGDVPKRRDKGKTHEVARFKGVQQNVNYYMRTLNSHPAYESLREIRHGLRVKQQPLTGVALAPGLLSYSERREVYVAEIRQMIRYNKLSRFNRSL